MSDALSRIHHPFEEMAAEDAGRAPVGEEARGPTARSDASPAWTSHPIDIRLSIPFGFGRWYVTLVAGPERRHPKRREVERRKHPLFTLGNIVFLFILGSVIGAAAVSLMINGGVWLFNGSYTVIAP
jgi:hypothetical protein